MRLDLSDTGYQNLRGTGAGVMSAGFIIYGIGSAAWPGGLLGDPFGLRSLRSTLAPSCYPSYLGTGHISVRRRRHRPPAS